MEFVWNPDKNEWLKTQRGVSFEQLVAAIEAGNILDVIPNTDPAQQERFMYVVYYADYTWVVPFHEAEDKIVLHTAFRSRKMMGRFGLR